MEGKFDFKVKWLSFPFLTFCHFKVYRCVSGKRYAEGTHGIRLFS